MGTAAFVARFAVFLWFGIGDAGRIDLVAGAMVVTGSARGVGAS